MTAGLGGSVTCVLTVVSQECGRAVAFLNVQLHRCSTYKMHNAFISWRHGCPMLSMLQKRAGSESKGGVLDNVVGKNGVGRIPVRRGRLLYSLGMENASPGACSNSSSATLLRAFVTLVDVFSASLCSTPCTLLALLSAHVQYELSCVLCCIGS